MDAVCDSRSSECGKPASVKTSTLRRRPQLKVMVVQFLSENALILATLVGIVVGFCVGLGLQGTDPSPDVLEFVGLPGELFLRALKSTIVPIVVCMTITATATVDPRSNGRMAVVAFGSFLVTHAVAVIIAVVVFLILRPDANSLLESSQHQRRVDTKLQTQDIFLDLIRNIVPDNVVSATVSKAITVYDQEEYLATNSTTNSTYVILKDTRSQGQSSGVNILGLITICTAVGIASNRVLSRDSAFLAFFRQGQEVILLIMHWLAWTTPVGVASLIAESIAGVSDLGSVFYAIGRLVLIVVLGLAAHNLAILPAILVLLRRVNPFVFLARCVKAYFVGFAACSTSVAIPHMLEACEQNGVSQGIARFVIPMTVTLHADGSALYIAAASLFLGQTTGEAGLDEAGVVVIALLSGLLSLALPPIPSSSIVIIVIILTSLNLPLHGIALLFTVEWLLDRLRSGVNAATHVMCAAFTDSICRGRGQQEPEAQDKNVESWDMKVKDKDEVGSEGRGQRGELQEVTTAVLERKNGIIVESAK